MKSFKSKKYSITGDIFIFLYVIVCMYVFFLVNLVHLEPIGLHALVGICRYCRRRKLSLLTPVLSKV